MVYLEKIITGYRSCSSSKLGGGCWFFPLLEVCTTPLGIMTAKLHGGDFQKSPSPKTSESFVEAHGVFSNQDLSSMSGTTKS